jgi:hypothetical protein
VGIPEINKKKLIHAPGIKLICCPGPTVKRFYIDTANVVKIVAFKRSIRKFLNIHNSGLYWWPNASPNMFI